MSKSILAIILSTSLFFTGCNKDHGNVNEQAQQTIAEAMLESGVATENIILTEKIKGQNAFSVYEKNNGFGVVHYIQTENGWQYRGASGFEQPASVNPDPLTISTTTWLMGEYSLKSENTYKTIFIGEIHNTDIAKVILEIDQGRINANILHSGKRKFWYHPSEIDNAPSLATKISAYSSQGKLLFEKQLSLGE